MSIIALLVALLLPSLGKAREQARIASCASLVRQLAMAGQLYAQNSKGWLPDDQWRLKSQMGQYVFNADIGAPDFKCPDVLLEIATPPPYFGQTYAMNMYGFTNNPFGGPGGVYVPKRENLSQAPRPSEVLFFCDSPKTNTSIGHRYVGDYFLADRHYSQTTGIVTDFRGRTANIVFLDCHVKFFNRSFFDSATTASLDPMLVLP